MDLPVEEEEAVIRVVVVVTLVVTEAVAAAVTMVGMVFSSVEEELTGTRDHPA
jgi:hypothetical protein